MTERQDDSTIPADEKLWRRIRSDQLTREAEGQYSVSSAAFRDKTGEVSVHLGSLTTPECALEAYPGFSLAELPASVPRGQGLRIARDPLPDDASHAVIFPAPTKGQAKALARACTLIVLVTPPLDSSA